MALFELIFRALARRHHACHLDFHNGVNVRRGALARDHVLSDLPAHGRHGNNLGRTRKGHERRGQRRRFGRRCRRDGRGRRCHRPTLLDEIQNVFLIDPATQPRAHHPAQIHMVLPRNAPHQRRGAGFPRLFVLGERLRRDSRQRSRRSNLRLVHGGFRRGGSRDCCVFAVDDGYDRIHGHRLVLLHEDLRKHARRGGGDLRIDLVRRDLE